MSTRVLVASASRHGGTDELAHAIASTSGPIGKGAAAEPFDASDLVRRTRAREHRLFGGRLLKDSLALRERALAGLIRAEEGDYREWPAVTAWATAIARTLTDDQAT